MKFDIGAAIRVMPFSELQWIYEMKDKRSDVPLRYFSLRMITFFGSIGRVTDRHVTKQGTELYRISNDRGENVWDGQLLRTE